jgi:hypothetical protein
MQPFDNCRSSSIDNCLLIQNILIAISVPGSLDAELQSASNLSVILDVNNQEKQKMGMLPLIIS